MAGIALAVVTLVLASVDAEGENDAFHAGRLTAGMLPVLLGPLPALRFARGTDRVRVAAVVCAASMILFALKTVADGEPAALIQIAGGIVIITQLVQTPAKEWFDRPASQRA